MSYSAILLVGGFGTRLSPLTKNTPKPMLPVAGVPFIEHQIAKAREADIHEIVLATSFMAEIFEPYFGDGSEHGISIKYAVEKTALGTGGAISNAGQMLSGSGPVIIFNGDVLSGHDLSGQIRSHEMQGAEVTLYLTQVADARPYGAVELDTAGNVLAFREKMENPPTNTINAGCYIFSRKVISEIPTGQVISIESETFPDLLAQGARVKGFVDNSYWLDIGTPQALLKASHDLVTGVLHSGATPPHEDDCLILEGATVEVGATVSHGTVIGEKSFVSSDSLLENCLVGRNVKVGAGSVLRNCFVADGYEIPANTLADFNFFGY